VANERFIQRDFKSMASRPRHGPRTPRGHFNAQTLMNHPLINKVRSLHPATWVLAAAVALATIGINQITGTGAAASTGFVQSSLEVPVMRAVPPAAEIEEPEWTVAQVRSGDTLADIFSRQGLSARTVHNVVNIDSETQRLTRIYPGDEVLFHIPEPGELHALRYELDEVRLLEVLRADDGFKASIIERPLDRRIVNSTGAIESSLFVAGQNAGMSDALIMKLAAIFGWDIDFILDIRAGDTFTVVYDEVWRDGEKLRDGDILAAEFLNRGKSFYAVRYTPAGTDHPEYYDADGRNLRKEFLRSPLDITRVTSRFTMKRFHPILKVNRPHRGVDYGAGSGTPVRATGDGKVIFASKNNSYGNHVIIQHGSQYKTLYGHLSKFGKGVRRGTRVRQGQIIGYVGSTGLATAAHLHYEFRENDQHRDPLRIRFPKADPLPSNEMAVFERQARPLLAQLDLLRSNHVLADAGSGAGAAPPAE